MLRAAVRIAVTCLVIVASGTACGAESSRPSQTMSAPRAGTKYISKRYGYEIVLRGKYTMYPATGQWDGGFPFGASGKVDLIVDDTQDGKFAVAAKPVPSGCRCHDGKPSLCACNDNIATGCDISGPRLLAAYPAREFVNA